MIGIYRFLKKHHSKVISVASAATIQRLIDCLKKSNIDNIGDNIWIFFDFHEGAALFMYGSIIVLAFWLIVEIILKNYLKKDAENEEFSSMMMEYVDKCIIRQDEKSGLMGAIAWGQDRTICYSDDIIFGWKSTDIVLSDYNDAYYEFTEEDKKLYDVFAAEKKSVQIQKEENNMDRVMLVSQRKNFNKSKKKLVLNMRKTDFNHARFIWSKENHLDYLNDFLEKKTTKPNSLCMHLIIETSCNSIVSTVISKYKDNDYSDTYAVTLGEQLETDDIHWNGNDYNENFMNIWLHRALREELGITDSDFIDLVEDDSFRILSLNYEGDIYNFALVCVVRFKCNYEKFVEKVTTFTDNQETRRFERIEIDEIPYILLNKAKDTNITSYIYNKEKKTKDCHPSTYLRLLMFYLYKKGRNRGCNLILDTYKKKLHVDKV